MLKAVIKDRDFIELVRRFLKAGYRQNNKYTETEEGMPQGGVISSILDNHLITSLKNNLKCCAKVNNFKIKDNVQYSYKNTYISYTM